GQRGGERDAPRRRRDGAPDPRLSRADGVRGRVQAGGRHPQGEAGARMAHPHEGRAGRSLAPRRPVPPRRVGAAHRHRAPARALRDVAVLGGASPSDGMTTVSELFETMAYEPAPERDKLSVEWSAYYGSGFALF